MSLSYRGRSGERFMSASKLFVYLRVCAIALIVSTPLASVQASELQSVWQGVDRIVAIGDVHGDYEGYKEVLRAAGIINRRGKWDAGNTHFVQVGDVPDRGPDTDKIIDHLMDLEKQAERDGGRVHALIGNHEAMNMLGDLRYVDAGEFEALKSRNAKRLRQGYYDRVVEYLSQQPEPPVIDEAFRDKWMSEHPLGWVEHRQFWDPKGEYGRWVLSHNAVIKINDVLFVHGGLGPSMLERSIEGINDQVRRELAEPGNASDLLVDAEDGPLWYRGLAATENETETLHLAALQEHFGVSTVVIGHTPGYGTVVPRYAGQVLVIDTGISAHYGGHRASIEITAEERVVVQAGQRVALPRSKAEELPYFKKMAELNPTAKNLAVLIQRLESPALEGSEPEQEP